MKSIKPEIFLIDTGPQSDCFGLFHERTQIRIIIKAPSDEKAADILVHYMEKNYD